MVGSGLVTHPWAFSEAGLLLSILITLITYGACFYTTYILFIAAGTDEDFTVTLYRFYGK
jgi:amino acid permease